MWEFSSFKKFDCLTLKKIQAIHHKACTTKTNKDQSKSNSLKSWKLGWALGVGFLYWASDTAELNSFISVDRAIHNA